MLDHPFPVPSLCKLNHISVCSIQISKEITTKQLIPFRENHIFFQVIPDVLGRSVYFNIIQRYLLRRPIFPFLVTMISLMLSLKKFIHLQSCCIKQEQLSCHKMFSKNTILKHFAKFTVMHLCRSLFSSSVILQHY